MQPLLSGVNSNRQHVVSVYTFTIKLPWQKSSHNEFRFYCSYMYCRVYADNIAFDLHIFNDI
jgi:hypothetical protein